MHFHFLLEYCTPFFYTSTKSWRGYNLYFHSSLSVCVSVCVSGSFLVDKIPAERVHRFGRGFRYMVAYCTGSDPIEFGDLGSKVKVTVTENVSKNDEKNSPKIQI